MARLGAAGRGLAGQYAYWRAVSPVNFPRQCWARQGGVGLGRAGRGSAGQHACLWAVSQDNFSRRGRARTGRARLGVAGRGMATRLPMSGIIGQFSVNFGQNNKTQ